MQTSHVKSQTKHSAQRSEVANDQNSCFAVLEQANCGQARANISARKI